MGEAHPSRDKVRFGAFEADLRAGELRKHGMKVKLQEQPFQVLQVLLESPGQVVTREELRRRIWPADTFVDFDHGLYNAIKRLREALGDSAKNPRFVETLSRRGYRFIASIDRARGAMGHGGGSLNHLAGQPCDEKGGLHAVDSWPTHPSAGEVELPQSRQLRPALVFAALGALTLGVIVVLLTRVPTWKASHGTSAPFELTRISRLTDTGRTRHAAISPDGKYVVHVDEHAGKQSFWVRQVVTGHDVQIVPPEDSDCWGLTFTPDGNYIYAVVRDRAGVRGDLFQFPILGGARRKVMADVDSPVSFSPDGKRTAFTRTDLVHKPVLSQLLLANADGTSEQVLVSSEAPRGFSSGGPAWSPDGKSIAVAYLSFFGPPRARLVEVDVATGTIKPIAEREWQAIGRVAWLRNGRGLLIQATDFDTSRQLWTIAYPGGEARRLTNDVAQYNYEDVSLTADSRTLLAVQSDFESHIWVAEHGMPPRQISHGNGRHDGMAGLAWTPQNQIVYATAHFHAAGELWMMGPDGSNPHRLTSNGFVNELPDVSPDGRAVVFVSSAAGPLNIWKVNTDGDAFKRLTTGTFELTPATSPDGKWILYTSGQSGKIVLRKIPFAGGEPVPISLVSPGEPLYPGISHDGSLLSYKEVGDRTGQILVRIVPSGGGTPIGTFRLPTFIDLPLVNTPVRWGPDGKSLTYVRTESGVSNIWAQPLDGSSPQQITRYKSHKIFWFAQSRDGKRLAFARGNLVSDAVLVTDSH